MFGWEFPPHISGGLGVACYDLTKSLSELDVDITFVLPTLKSKPESNLHLKLLSSSDVKIHKKDQIFSYEEFLSGINVLKIDSPIRPYITEEGYLKFLEEYNSKLNTTYLDKSYNLHFSGDYGPNLIAEVFRYSYIAGIISQKTPHDIIHAHDWMTALAGIEARKHSGKPFIYHVHALETDRSGINVNKEIYDLEKFALESADRIIAVSHFTKNNIIQFYGIDPSKISVVHNAVSRTKVSKQADLIRKKPDEKIVLFLGRVTFQKGPDYFLEAAAKVLKKTKKVRFVIAGYGDMVNKLVERSAELRIGRNVHFTGFLKREEVEQIFSASDVYVMSSVSEPFGISCLEAVLFDVPVIISKQSGVAEVLSHSLKVDFWDTDELANMIYALLKFPALEKELLTQASEELKQIQWINSAQRVKEIYEDLTLVRV
jgi:glycosyltransferase involved in cell wall biosynthesis